MTGTEADEAACANTVALRGRLTSAPLERQLPSGDVILTFRLTMPRTRTAMTNRSAQRSDWVECVAWTSRVRRSVVTWRVGDLVEVDGALRRRFFRTSVGASTKVEIEVLSGRRLRRAR